MCQCQTPVPSCLSVCWELNVSMITDDTFYCNVPENDLLMWWPVHFDLLLGGGCECVRPTRERHSAKAASVIFWWRADMRCSDVLGDLLVQLGMFLDRILWGVPCGAERVRSLECSGVMNLNCLNHFNKQSNLSVFAFCFFRVLILPLQFCKFVTTNLFTLRPSCVLFVLQPASLANFLQPDNTLQNKGMCLKHSPWVYEQISSGLLIVFLFYFIWEQGTRHANIQLV